MAGGVGEAHLVVLALHLDQQQAEPAQQRDPHRRIVGEGARAAVAGDDAAQHDLLLRRDAVLGEQRHRGVIGRWGEHGGDHGLLAAGAHQPLFGPGAQCQAEAVEQDRLAGAGLAGQHGEAGAETEVQPLDQHHVADRQRRQHRTVRRSSRTCGRTGRAGRSWAPARAAPSPARRRSAGRSCRRTMRCRGSCGPAPRRCAVPRRAGRA